VILLEGWDLKMTWTIMHEKKMLFDVVKVVNTRILGKPKCSSNWRIITTMDSENKTTHGDQSIPN
jgi:hypothetical protein